jgi:flavodoxin
MNAMVVYDSWYGNTEEIARAIAGELGPARLVRQRALGAADLAGYDLLVIGSPTHAGGMSVGMRAVMLRLAEAAVRGLAVAAFDTRFHQDIEHTGSAAMKVAELLEQKGARPIVPPESFFVGGLTGPLEGDEIGRAKAWAAKVREAALAAEPLLTRENAQTGTGTGTGTSGVQ